MQKLTLTKKLKIYSREDILEAIQFIEKDVYFANSIEEFKTIDLQKLELEKIDIAKADDLSIFCNEHSHYNFIAVEE